MEELLEKIKRLELEHLDFEWVLPDDPEPYSLIPAKAMQSLSVFAKQASGAQIALWKKEGRMPLSSPIVWIDSESFPNTVISQNPLQFFALLPYGTGLIHDLAYGLARFMQNRKANQGYLKGFTPKYLATELEGVRSNQLNQPLIDLLKSEWQTELIENPLTAMLTAIEKERSFGRWLKTNS